MKNKKEQELLEEIKSMTNYDPSFRKRYLAKEEAAETENEIETEDEAEIIQEIANTEEINEEVLALDETESEVIDEITADVNADLSDDTMVLVKIGGEEKEISLSDLKSGYMMQSDYTKKTQELSMLRDEYSSGLKRAMDAMSAFNDASHTPKFREEELHLKNILDRTNWETVTDDEMGELVKLKIKYEKLRQDNERYMANMENMRSAMKQETAIYHQRLRQEQIEKLIEVLPDLADDGKRKEITQQITNYLQDRLGKDKVEKVMNGIKDHRDFLILRDAMVGNDYLTKKLPRKSVIKPTKRFGNDGIKEGSFDTSKKTMGAKTLRNVKSRGERAPASKDELMAILASKI